MKGGSPKSSSDDDDDDDGGGAEPEGGGTTSEAGPGTEALGGGRLIRPRPRLLPAKETPGWLLSRWGGRP